MDAGNVSFGKPKATGAVFVAPKGTAVPTDATTALGASFKNLGYISEDGLVDSIETDTTDIKAWGGDVVLSGQSSFAETFTVNLLETNVDTLKAIYGEANVTENDGVISVAVTAAELPEQVVVFETVLTGGRIKRIVVPHAKIVDRSQEISYTDGDAIIYPAKFKAFPDTNGSYHNEYIATSGVTSL